MSRLFPDRLLIGLAPAALTFARVRGFFRKNLVEEGKAECDPAFGAEPWQGALAALKSMEFKQGGPARVTVVLSNHFVRYAIVPWSDRLGGAAEEEAYIRHHFTKIHGERAKGWVVRASESGPGAPRLASAIDTVLLSQLKQAFEKKPGVKLVSVQPQLMATFNQWRKAFPAGGAWLVVADAERACVALHASEGWRSVLNAKGAWLPLLERERYRVTGGVTGAATGAAAAGGSGLPDLVLLAGVRAPQEAPQAGGWKFRELTAETA